MNKSEWRTFIFRDKVVLIGFFDIFISITVIFNNLQLLLDKFYEFRLKNQNSVSYLDIVVDIFSICIYFMLMLSAGVLIRGAIKGKPEQLKSWMTFKLLLVVVGTLTQVVHMCFLSVKSQKATDSKLVNFVLLMEVSLAVHFGKPYKEQVCI